MLWLIWLFFATIFLALAVFHFRESGRSIPSFTLKQRPGSKMGKIQVLGADIDQPIREFVPEFNGFIQKYNKSSRLQNRFQALGYLLAGLTALFSLYLELPRVN